MRFSDGGYGRAVTLVLKMREELNLTQEELASQAKVSEKTIRNLEAGKRVRDSTYRRICAALGVPVETVSAALPPRSLSFDAGSYTEEGIRDYIGTYRVVRFDFLERDTIVVSEASIYWNDPLGVCSYCEKTPHDSFHEGVLYTSAVIGLFHIIAVNRGAVRMLTLSRLNPIARSMRGQMLSQMSSADHYVPCSTPIVLQKTSDESAEPMELSESDQIDSSFSEYAELCDLLRSTERNFLRRPPTLEPPLETAKARRDAP